jgi:adenosylcobinamide-phosphate synthase
LSPVLTTTLTALGALLLDWRFGEPRRAHPLVGFGRLAQAVESFTYGSGTCAPGQRRIRGVIAWLILILPTAVAAAWASRLPGIGAAFDLLALSFAIGHRSLHQHARAVSDALERQDEADARRLASYMVSRDPETLEIPKATTESVLENGSDAVFGALFWFVIGGATGCLVYRFANTLDALWGYRSERYRDFGWAAARLDDLLNYLPARLTALSYALTGHTLQAIRCWRTQARAWDSPNAGPVMAAGAGALNVTLGGPARYRGEWHSRPILGSGPTPGAQDIRRALRLVSASLVLWLPLPLLADLFRTLNA